MDLGTIKPVQLPGSDDWESSYSWSQELEEAFPDQDAYSLTSAIQYNDPGPTSTMRITGLRLIEQGYNDGPDWIWQVRFEDGSIWQAQGGCDYTGWDCQSNLGWEMLSEATPLDEAVVAEAAEALARLVKEEDDDTP